MFPFHTLYLRHDTLSINHLINDMRNIHLFCFFIQKNNDFHVLNPLPVIYLPSIYLLHTVSFKHFSKLQFYGQHQLGYSAMRLHSELSFVVTMHQLLHDNRLSTTSVPDKLLWTNGKKIRKTDGSFNDWFNFVGHTKTIGAKGSDITGKEEGSRLEMVE